MAEGPVDASVPVSTDALSPAYQLASGAPRFLIRVIGPIELVVEGRQVSLRSSRTRRLVAMLVLYRDRLVSGDRLIDAVWGEELPADPKCRTAESAVTGPVVAAQGCIRMFTRN